MKKTAVKFVVLVMTFTLFGCGAPEDVRVRVHGDRTVGIKRGQTLKIELTANPTTGYIWELTESVNNGVLRRIGKYEYVQGAARIGAGGVQTYRFEGVKRGSSKLVFKYKRPWEKGKKPAERYIVRVMVH